MTWEFENEAIRRLARVSMNMTWEFENDVIEPS